MPTIIILLIARFLVTNAYIHYLLYCLAATVAGIGLSYLAPILTSRCKIMKLLPGQAEDYEHRYPNAVPQMR